MVIFGFLKDANNLTQNRINETVTLVFEGRRFGMIRSFEGIDCGGNRMGNWACEPGVGFLL